MRELTKAERTWLETKAMPNYLIYSSSEKKVYCLNCKTEFDAKLLPTRKIGKEVDCPCCKEKGKIKNKKFTGITWEEGTAIIPDGLNLRYFYMQRKYDKYWENYTTTYRECFREEFETNGTFHVTDRRYGEDNWRNCKVGDGYQISWYTHRPLGTHINLPNQNVSIYTRNLTKYSKGTPMERVPLYKIFANKKLESRYDVWAVYLDSLTGYANYFEYIFKVGMDNLAYELVTKNPWKYVKKDERSLINMWSLSKETYRELLQLGNKATLEDLNRFQKYTEFNIMSQRDREVFDKFIAKSVEHIDVEKFLKILPVTLNKFGRWAETQQEFHILTYIDYLKMCRELKLDMKNTFVSLPKELKSAHDMVTDMYNEMKFDIKLKHYADEANNYTNDYAKIVPVREKQYAYEKDNIKIVIPKTTRDIGHEGYKLRHCVAQYMQDVVANKKTILFVRNVNEPDVPFFTMEIIGKKITQCKGYRNCPRPKEVESFLKSFAKSKHLSIAKDEHFAAVM